MAKTAEPARRRVKIGQKNDGVNAFRGLCNEYNPVLMSGAAALPCKALAMGRCKNMGEVTDTILELEELTTRYEAHPGYTFPEPFKVQQILDIIPEDAERQLVLSNGGRTDVINYRALVHR